MKYYTKPPIGWPSDITTSDFSSNRRRRYGFGPSTVSPDLLVAYLKDRREAAHAKACELKNTVVVDLVAVRAALRDGAL